LRFEVLFATVTVFCEARRLFWPSVNLHPFQFPTVGLRFRLSRDAACSFEHWWSSTALLGSTSQKRFPLLTWFGYLQVRPVENIQSPLRSLQLREWRQFALSSAAVTSCTHGGDPLGRPVHDPYRVCPVYR
jgi:hypothetical protein